MGLLCDVTPSYIIQRSDYVSLSWKQNFLYLNKLWSCKYGRKTKKLTCMTFLYIWFVRQYKWLSLLRKVVEIQKILLPWLPDITFLLLQKAPGSFQRILVPPDYLVPRDEVAPKSLTFLLVTWSSICTRMLSTQKLRHCCHFYLSLKLTKPPGKIKKQQFIFSCLTLPYTLPKLCILPNNDQKILSPSPVATFVFSPGS